MCAVSEQRLSRYRNRGGAAVRLSDVGAQRGDGYSGGKRCTTNWIGASHGSFGSLVSRDEMIGRYGSLE